MRQHPVVAPAAGDRAVADLAPVAVLCSVRRRYSAQRPFDAATPDKAIPLEEDRRLARAHGLLRLLERESHSILDGEHRRWDVGGLMADLNT